MLSNVYYHWMFFIRYCYLKYELIFLRANLIQISFNFYNTLFPIKSFMMNLKNLINQFNHHFNNDLYLIAKVYSLYETDKLTFIERLSFYSCVYCTEIINMCSLPVSL